LRVVWSTEANNDLEQIWTYLARNASVERADYQAARIVEACGLLSEWPRSGRARDEVVPGLRSVAAEPYVVFYRTGDARVEIVRVLDGRRDIEAVLGRKP
jgi:toxin ParE1/3/4